MFEKIVDAISSLDVTLFYSLSQESGGAVLGTWNSQFSSALMTWYSQWGPLPNWPEERKKRGILILQEIHKKFPDFLWIEDDDSFDIAWDVIPCLGISPDFFEEIFGVMEGVSPEKWSRIAWASVAAMMTGAEIKKTTQNPSRQFWPGNAGYEWLSVALNEGGISPHSIRIGHPVDSDSLLECVAQGGYSNEAIECLMVNGAMAFVAPSLYRPSALIAASRQRAVEEIKTMLYWETERIAHGMGDVEALNQSLYLLYELSGLKPTLKDQKFMKRIVAHLNVLDPKRCRIQMGGVVKKSAEQGDAFWTEFWVSFGAPLRIAVKYGQGLAKVYAEKEALLRSSPKKSSPRTMKRF